MLVEYPQDSYTFAHMNSQRVKVPGIDGHLPRTTYLLQTLEDADIQHIKVLELYKRFLHSPTLSFLPLDT